MLGVRAGNAPSSRPIAQTTRYGSAAQARHRRECHGTSRHAAAGGRVDRGGERRLNDRQPQRLADASAKHVVAQRRERDVNFAGGFGVVGGRQDEVS